jgi:hypothetical protein
MTNVIIFSVFQSNCSEDVNYSNTIKVENMLERAKIPFKALSGMYKGIKEESFAIDLKHQNAALELARQFNQESILIIDSSSRATLKYMPVSIESDISIGYFQEVSETKAKSLDAWTLDIDTGTYYACLPERRESDRVSFDTRTWSIQ